MNLPKEFEEYIKKGVIKKCSIDKSRAEFLINESQNSLDGLYERIEIIGINDKNANSIIKDCYDILMELIRAKLLLTGYSSAGQFAHEAEISYLKKLGFSDIEVSFLNDLRYFRNSVTYYGKILDKEYAKKVLDFTNGIYPKLKKMIE
jgi:hypothetical protein